MGDVVGSSSRAATIKDIQRPGAMAVGPHGQLYVADDNLDEILQVLPNGTFIVIAGNGKAGYSGDGGRAVAASLNDPGGIAVTPTGALLIADSGNNRIREVSTGGVISTVAGDGRASTWVRSGIRARLGSLSDPAAVAIGPNGCLYIADEGANEILEVNPAGRLVEIAGVQGASGLQGIGRPATSASPDGPTGLALNRSGELFIAGFNTKSLLVISNTGVMKSIGEAESFYPMGRGGLVSSTGNVVIAMNGQRIERVGSAGLKAIITFPRENVTGIRNFVPNGVAIAANGTVYADTYRGNGYVNASAIVKISPNGQVNVLWRG